MTTTRKEELDNLKTKINELSKERHLLVRKLGKVNDELDTLTNTRLTLLYVKDV